MRRFTKFIGRLPFCGKYRIRKWSFRFYYSTTPAERRKHYCILLIMLLFDVLSHSFLAWLGLSALTTLAPAWANLVFVLYCIANGCSAVAQAHLIYRASRFHFDLTSPYPRRPRSLPAYKFSGRVACIAFTAAGQLLFIAAYVQFT